MFISVNGKAEEVKEIFAGGTDGFAHKVNEVFGSVNGVAKLIFTTVPHEKNKFDELTWAEIKILADAGRLLEFFKVGDKVDIKFKEPLQGTYTLWGHDCEWMQDAATWQIIELTETGMKLAIYNELPLSYHIDVYPATGKKSTFFSDCAYSTDTKGRWLDYRIWGLLGGYDPCHEIDEKLPDDLRETLVDFSPLIEWEHYLDNEDKNRLRKVYDDCRVRHITKSCYVYHREFVKENDRYEYILDFSAFPRKESIFKKYVPEEIRKYTSTVRGFLGLKYVKDGQWNGVRDPDVIYKCLWQDADISWTWDWEKYGNRNQQDMIDEPIYTTSLNCSGLFIPEIIIGEQMANKDIVGTYLPSPNLTSNISGPV